MEPLAPPTPRLSVCHDRWTRRLGFTNYDAYIIASTAHAVSYVSPTGTLLTGQEKTSISQRVSRAWKHIGEKIHNYCSHLSTLRSMLQSRVGPTCRGPNVLRNRTPWSIKGGRPLEEGRLGESQDRAEDRFIHNQETKLLPVDVGYYAPAARTTLDRVFLCACLSARLAQSPSTSPSTPSLGIGGCVPPPG